jgi:hypothetical protein
VTNSGGHLADCMVAEIGADLFASYIVSVEATGTWSAGIGIDAAEGLADHADLALT